MISLYEFETLEAPTVDVPAGAELSPEPAAPTGASSEGDTPAPATVEAPAWDEAAMREAAQQEAEALLDARLAQLQAQQPQVANEDLPPELDPFSPEYAQQLRDMIRAEIAPLRENAQAQQEAANQAHWNTVVEDVIADETSRNGDLSTDEIGALNLIAVTIMPQMQAKYGQTPRAVEATVAKAAAQVRAITAAAEVRAVERYKNELGGLAGARQELGASGAGGGMQGLTQAQTIEQVVARHAPILSGAPAQ